MLCMQEIKRLIEPSEIVCICCGDTYKDYFTVSARLLRNSLHICMKISVMPTGKYTGKLCLHTDKKSYEEMLNYFKNYSYR